MHLQIKSILLLALVVMGSVISTEGKAQDLYSISGTVVDGLTGETLPGATIILKNSMFGTSTDGDGAFSLKKIRSRKVKLEVSYIGYIDQTIELDLSDKSDQKITVELQSSSTQLEQVQIIGSATGQTKAFNEQRAASNIKNVVSSQQIQQFPDINAADAMQRIPGITLQRDQGEGRYVQLRGTPPELTNFNINGEQIPSPEGSVRYVGMDIIAADQIETIEITKVLTPDMDADGIGGNVNIVTKSATSEKPQITAGLAGIYNNLRQSPGFNGQFSFGQRYKKFGFQVGANYYINQQGSDNMEFKYAKGPFWGSQEDGVDNYHVQYREFQLRHYDITRQRVGLNAALDYHFSDRSIIYLRGMYNSFSDDEVRRRKIYELDDAVSEKYYLYGDIMHDVKDRVKIQDIYSINLGGSHGIKKATVDYEVAYSVANEAEPDRMEARFENWGQAIQMKFDLSDPDWPRIYFPDEESAVYAESYDLYELDPIFFAKSIVKDKNLTGKINFTIPYLSNPSSNGFIKFGGKARVKEKTRDRTVQEYGAYRQTSNTYPGEGPPLNLVTVDDGFREYNLLNQNYVLEYMPGSDFMRDFYNFNTQFFILDRTSTKTKTYGEDYYANEKIYAAYVMIQHNFNRLMLLGGIRYERTDIDYRGMRIITEKGNFSDMDTLYDKRTHEFVLPQIQARYALRENLNLRAAVTYSYSRPNFTDVLPYREVDYDEVKYGNPDLLYPTSVNADVMAEYYLLRGQGLLSGGIFFKNIDNFVFYYKRFAHEGDPKDYGLVEITKAVNGNEAYVFGSELNAQFKFWFLPGIAKNFGVYMNYTYTYSKAYINQRYPANYTDAVVIFGEDDLSLYQNDSVQEEIPLPGQSPHTANLAAFYESQRLYVRLSANYHASFLYELGADADLDEYYYKAWHLDFTANYAITPNVRVFTDWINLTNAPLKFYLGTPDRIKKQEYYSWSCRFGIKFKF